MNLQRILTAICALAVATLAPCQGLGLQRLGNGHVGHGGYPITPQGRMLGFNRGVEPCFGLLVGGPPDAIAGPFVMKQTCPAPAILLWPKVDPFALPQIARVVVPPLPAGIALRVQGYTARLVNRQRDRQRDG